MLTEIQYCVYLKPICFNPMTRHLLPTVLLLAFAVILAGCDGGIADLDVENRNDPTRSDLSSAEDLQQLLKGSTAQAMQVTVTDWGPHMDLLADQTTSTNAFRSFWDFADPQFRRLDNSTTYANPAIFGDPYSNLNGGQTGANSVLSVTEGDDSELQAGDRTIAKLRAGAYFLRGVSRGYLGLIYNQAYVVPEDVEDPTSAELLAPYDQVIDAAVSDLEQAITIAENNDFTWDLLVGNTYTSAEFEAIAHSMAAKISMGEARTRSELEDFSDQRLDNIISHAEDGVGGGSALASFTPTSTSGTFVHALAGWSTFIISGPAGYLPMDVKVSHLLDPSYPVDYPGGETTLGPHNTPDPRGQSDGPDSLNDGYFWYTDAFGFLSSARNKTLFSNYARLRLDGGNNWFNFDGEPVPIATNSEMQYLKAEAHLIKGETGAAATALENSPFGSVKTKFEADLPIISRGSETNQIGGFADDAAEDTLAADTYALDANSIAAGKNSGDLNTEADFVRALHTEYSVELDLLAGVGAQWYFMRRHDLLAEGVALHYPLPGQEIEILNGVDPYTFGGPDNTDDPFTAGGSSGSATPWTSWKDFDSVTGVSAPVGFSKHTRGKSTSSPTRKQGNLNARTSGTVDGPPK